MSYKFLSTILGIDANFTGNVGVGTTTPSYKLDVNGTGRFQSTLTADGQINTNALAGFNVKSGTDTLVSLGYSGGALLNRLTGTNFYIAQNGSPELTINTSGNVGIGTTSPISYVGYKILSLDGVTGTFTSYSQNNVELFRVGADSNRPFLYSTTGTPMDFYMSTTVAMRIASSGNVLIGTTTDAGYKLQVNGSLYWGNPSGEYMYAGGSGHKFAHSTSTGNWLYSGGSTGLRINNAADSLNLVLITDGGTVTIANLAGSGTRMVTADSSGTLSTAAIPTGTVTGSGTTNYISKWTSSTGLGNSVIYDNGTNIGIGVTNPGNKLVLPNNQYLAWKDSVGIESVGISTNSSDALTFFNIAERMRITAAGNVGIGTINLYHSALLSVAGKLFLPFQSNANIGGTIYGYNDTSYQSYEGGLKFQSFKWNGSSYNMEDAMTINGQGNIGIGTTSPLLTTLGRGNLTINGDYQSILTLGVGNNWKTYLYTNGTDSYLGAMGEISFSVNGAGTLGMKIASSGNLLIGTTTDAGYKLDVNGTGRFSGSSNATLYLNNTSANTWRISSAANGNFYLTQDGVVDAMIVNPSTAIVTLPSIAGSGTRMVVADSSGTLSTQAIPGGGSANGSWQDNNTQTVPNNLTGYGVEFSTLNFRTGINVIQDTGSKFTLIQMTNAGRYNIQFSFQFQNTSSSAHDVYVWFRKNGENTPDDIPDSNTLISVPAKHGSGTPGHIVAAWNFFVEAAPMDYYQIAWATDDKTSVTMEYYSPTGFCPGTPSAILTVNQVN